MVIVDSCSIQTPANININTVFPPLPTSPLHTVIPHHLIFLHNGTIRHYLLLFPQPQGYEGMYTICT